jgi:hypothetical protein
VVTYRIAFGPRAGIDGFSLHAAVRIEAHDRRRLERLCRYITRPVLSEERIQVNATELRRCPSCGAGELKIIAAILQRAAIEKTRSPAAFTPGCFWCASETAPSRRAAPCPWRLLPLPGLGTAFEISPFMGQRSTATI